MGRVVKILASVLFSVCMFSVGFWLYTVFSSPFCRQHPGIVLVVVGFIGAFIFGHERAKTLGKRLAWWFDALLLIGLLLEMREAVNEDSKILALQKELAPRRITDEQREIFKTLLSDPSLIKGNCAIFITVDENNIEGRVFSAQIEETLKDCGFPVSVSPIMVLLPGPENVEFGLRFFTHSPPSYEAGKLLDAFRAALPDDVPIDASNGKMIVSGTATPGLYINVEQKPLPKD